MLPTGSWGGEDLWRGTVVEMRTIDGIVDAPNDLGDRIVVEEK